MTRFNMSIMDSVNMVLWSIQNNQGAEIFVPKIPSYKILDLAKSLGPKCKIKITGIRPGEKIEEELITKSESRNTIDIGKYYVILDNASMNIKKYYMNKKFKKVKENFSYTSGTNNKFLSINELKKIIIKENL